MDFFIHAIEFVGIFSLQESKQLQYIHVNENIQEKKDEREKNVN